MVLDDNTVGDDAVVADVSEETTDADAQVSDETKTDEVKASEDQVSTEA